MDGNWQVAVVAAIEQAGFRRAGYVPDVGHALHIQEMHAIDERAASLPGVPPLSSVVRSVRRTASSRAKRFDPRLTGRLATSAALASTPPRRRTRCAGTEARAESHRSPGAQPARGSRRRV